MAIPLDRLVPQSHTVRLLSLVPQKESTGGSGHGRGKPEPPSGTTGRRAGVGGSYPPPPPPLSSMRLGMTVPSHPGGNLPRLTVPSPPPPPPRLVEKRHATQNKRAKPRACEPQNDQKTACITVRQPLEVLPDDNNRRHGTHQTKIQKFLVSFVAEIAKT